jgi:hypothetical protein
MSDGFYHGIYLRRLNASWRLTEGISLFFCCPKTRLKGKGLTGNDNGSQIYVSPSLSMTAASSTTDTQNPFLTIACSHREFKPAPSLLLGVIPDCALESSML